LILMNVLLSKRMLDRVDNAEVLVATCEGSKTAGRVYQGR